jgi:hypothetical protein
MSPDSSISEGLDLLITNQQPDLSINTDLSNLPDLTIGEQPDLSILGDLSIPDSPTTCVRRTSIRPLHCLEGA